MITPQKFRRIALQMAGAVEGAHMNHPDFRANGRIFATIAPDGKQGMVKLTADQQQGYLDEYPHMFTPASGAWGRQGSTMVDFKSVDETILQGAMTLAFKNTQKQKAQRGSNKR